jgi:hypothetical protein
MRDSKVPVRLEQVYAFSLPAVTLDKRYRLSDYDMAVAKIAIDQQGMLGLVDQALFNLRRVSGLTGEPCP